MTNLMDSGLATAHAATIADLPCGSSYAYYLRAVNSTSSTLITFQIDPEVTSTPTTFKHGRFFGGIIK
jgi:hypothetical protein